MRAKDGRAIVSPFVGGAFRQNGIYLATGGSISICVRAFRSFCVAPPLFVIVYGDRVFAVSFCVICFLYHNATGPASASRQQSTLALLGGAVGR